MHVLWLPNGSHNLLAGQHESDVEKFIFVLFVCCYLYLERNFIKAP